MEEILLVRQMIIAFYKKNEKWLNPLAKFLSGLLFFSIITKIQYVELFSNFFTIILMAILSTLLPISLTSFLIIVIIVTQLISISLELAVLIAIALICFLLFYIRIFQKESILIFAMILAYYFKVPYLVVFIGSAFFGVLSIVPIAIATFIWNMIPAIEHLIEAGGTTIENIASIDLEQLPIEFAKTYNYILDFMKSDQTWIVNIIIFSMVIIVMYIIYQLQIDYSSYLAIAIACVLNIISFMMATLVANIDINMIGMIVSTIICSLIMCIFQFFSIVLDYPSAENLQFEDDSNYYYVKVVPKIYIKKSKKD